jgi:hypothetical protein
MKTKLDAAYLAILAALGLELACADRTGSGGGASETTQDGASASESGASGTSSSMGEGGSDSGSGEETETGPPPLIAECEDPTPIMQTGTDIPSGYVECANGIIHRVEEVECLNPENTDDSGCGPADCTSAADCTEGAYPSCKLNGYIVCDCVYGCVTDADCPAGYACACAGVIGPHTQCIPADCNTTADCGGELCRLGEHESLCETVYYGLVCTSPDDECIHDEDCPPELCPGASEGGTPQPYQCGFASGTGFVCEPTSNCYGACGRPLLVEGRPRSAAAIEREDWGHAVRVEALDAATRRRLAAHWSEVGRYEHASVASFARFAGHLLELGAPPRLLRETQRAMADEVEHARVAFGLASAYAGVVVGPGPLDIRGCVDERLDRAAIVEALIHEACVGETLAALEADEAAHQAGDPAVAAALEQIAADELRHAQLGWRSLRWMLDTGDDRLRAFAFACLDAALRTLEATAEDARPSAELRAHGVVDDGLRGQVHRRALARVLAPCVAALRQVCGAGELGAPGPAGRRLP